MKLEVTIERLRHGKWTQVAKGKFTEENHETMPRWLQSKGLNIDGPAPPVGWAVRVACLP